MNIKRENRLICFLLFCLAVTASGCGGVESDETNFSLTMHATELAREFETDRSRAHKTYTGERICVVGKVSSIVAAPDSTFALTFRTSVYSFTTTRCHFDAKDGDRLSGVKSNEEITIVGTVVGFDETANLIALENCRLL